MKGNTIESEEDEEKEEDAQGIAQEIARAVRNLAALKVRREKGPDGKRTFRDDARELAARVGNVREYVVEVLTRMELHRRDRRDIWYDPSIGKPPLVWLKETFEQVSFIPVQRSRRSAFEKWPA